MSAVTLLEVESLTKRYGSITAVDDLSFSVAPGETLGLLGPNGAGKTTTMGCIVGLLEPDGGHIAVDGLAPKSKTVSAMVGYAAQRTALYLSLRVSENLAYFGGLYGLRGRALAEAVAKIVDLFDLDSLTGRRVNDLSVGQAKLVHLASAVIHEPTLLLVDEPTAGLDVSARRRVIDAIRRLAAGGAAVVVFDRQAEPLQELAAELDGLACAGDVTRAGDVERAVAAAVDRNGRLDILVNAAGIMLRTRFFELEEDEFDRVVAVSLKGSFLASKAVAGPMRDNGFGRIVHFSSTAGRTVSTLGGCHYTAAKHGVLGLTRALAKELAPHGITVNAVCPGLIDTEMVRGTVTPERIAAYEESFPVSRLGTPEEVAEAVAFLTSEHAGYITGAPIDINGGGFMG